MNVFSFDWDEITPELESHIQCSEGLTAAYIQGPAGGGKSTTMFQAMSALFSNKFTDPRVMYVCPGQEHRELMKVFMAAMELVPDEECPEAQKLRDINDNNSLIQYTYKEMFAKWCANRKDFLGGRPTLIVWDLEILPSTDGVLAMTALMQSVVDVQKDYPKQRTAILVLAEHWSPKTYDNMKDRCGPSVEHFQFKIEEPVVPGWKVQDKAQEGLLSWRPEQVVDGRHCVVRGGCHRFKSGRFFELLDGNTLQTPGQALVSTGMKHNLWDIEGRTGARDWWVLLVRHDVSWSTAMDGLSTLYSPSQVHDVVMDQDTWQHIAGPRPITQPELARLHSWATKSMTRHGQPVEIVAPYTREEMATFPENVDAVAPAWNRDLLITVLRIAQAWEGVRGYDIPMRAPPGEDTWELAGIVLEGTGCLQCGEDNKLRISPFGTSVTTCLVGDAGWHTALLLAHAKQAAATQPSTSVVPWIICAMAALVQLDSAKLLFELQGQQNWPGLRARRELFDPLITQYTFRGSLWFQLAAWMKRQSVPRNQSPAHLGHGVHLWLDVAGTVEEHYDTYTRTIPRLNQSDRPFWGSFESLSDTDGEIIELILAQTFLYQCLQFGPAQDLSAVPPHQWCVCARDCHSGREVRVKGQRLVMQLNTIWRFSKLGFFAFYTGPLTLDTDGVPMTDEVTYLDPRILHRLATMQGRYWPSMVARDDWGMV